MKKFYNLKIRTKMLLCFGLVIACLLALAVFSVNQTKKINGTYTDVIRFTGGEKDLMLEFRSSVRDLRRVTVSMAAHSVLEDPAKIDSLYEEGRAAYGEGLRTLDEFDSELRLDTIISQAQRAELAGRGGEIRDVFVRYKAEVTDKVAQTARAGDPKASIEIITAGADIIGGLRADIEEIIAVADEIMESDTKYAQNAADMAVTLLYTVSAATTLLALVIALTMAKVFSDPLRPLMLFMKKAGTTGDISLTDEDTAVIGKYSRHKDEIGQTIAASASFIKHISDVAQTLERVADGDLTVEVPLLSEHDVIGASLQKTIDGLSAMFSEINASCAQVNTGASQVAEGSQSLAQGSTEQAAAVEQLSASIGDVSDKTKDNAKMALQASELSDSIERQAAKGNERMNRLMEAVEEITESSRAINKVIKVIDDIAFQTNILALNAAVEAARAGVHGKGFAVVAEEVRALSAKSAESAKDSGKLIEDSIVKSGLGLSIATETALSLGEIVDGVKQSAQLMARIAAASEEQAHAITQINIGIEQVSEVVQQNSATAEESAAASQQMSGQAAMLQEHVRRFRLKGEEETRLRLPQTVRGKY
ncbi:MAG: methyl-accepting chemotaxis protein [Oscillospiraceae bacterium]|jgi:methyl-accepting chemotaxis protein|nr:methyl-accepting chemotaxis protein [Oscillospiraceae bacterium]